MTLNMDGGVRSEIRYDAWGKTRYSSGTTPTDRQYTGQINESEVGLYFYNARWYDPLLGRFTQPDSIVPQLGSPLGWDRYAYTLNNPVNLVDPTGHKACINTDENGNCVRDPDWKPTMDPTILSQSKTPFIFPQEWTIPEKINALYNTANWSLQTPGDIDLYTTPGFLFFGGARLYVNVYGTIDHGAEITLGANSTQMGPLEISPDRISYQMGESTLDKGGTLVGLNVDLPLDPWAINIETDITLKRSRYSGTLTVGMEYLSRPDNMTLIPVTVSSVVAFKEAVVMTSSIPVVSRLCVVSGLCK